MTTLPDYAVSPGDHIKEWLDDHGINAAELARRLDVTPKHVSELLSGKAPLSAIACSASLARLAMPGLATNPSSARCARRALASMVR